jgi:hypothetical protein
MTVDQEVGDSNSPSGTTPFIQAKQLLDLLGPSSIFSVADPYADPTSIAARGVLPPPGVPDWSQLQRGSLHRVRVSARMAVSLSLDCVR